jgi:hypothetical protein
MNRRCFTTFVGKDRARLFEFHAAEGFALFYHS